MPLPQAMKITTTTVGRGTNQSKTLEKLTISNVPRCSFLAVSISGLKAGKVIDSRTGLQANYHAMWMARSPINHDNFLMVLRFSAKLSHKLRRRENEIFSEEKLFRK